MRRYGILLTVVALVAALAATQIPAAKNSFNFFLGQKWISDLSKDELEAGDLDLEKQPDIGIEMSFAGDDWPVMIAVDILGSAKDDSVTYAYYYYGYYYEADVESSTLEVDFGVRKTWELGGSRVRPYIGGGLATAFSKLKVDGDLDSFDDDASGTGFWVGGGVYWRLGERFNLGLNVRHSTAEVDFDDVGIKNVDVGGTHIGLVLGWGY